MRFPLALAASVAALVAAPAAAQAVDATVPSFDGTPIVAHWFPLDSSSSAPKPTVLMGPGWGSPGDVNVAGTGSTGVGVPGIATLHAAGYNVLTWDPRGFGKSGGTIEIDSPEFEGRDTQKLIDWVAAQPGVQLDAPGDPRMGMAGASYGGGIQLVTAALDKRVDAITPTIAWHSLATSLAKDETFKSGWAGLLYAAAAARSIDPHVKSSYETGLKRGTISAGNLDWFAARGPGDLVKQITAPTLFLQGTVDTLFTLDEAVENYGILRKANVPTKMLWFCGGHGACLTPQGDRNRASDATIAWLNRYVKGDASVATGPGFDGIDQNGTAFTASAYPPPASQAVTASGRGTLKLNATGGAGPAKIGPTAGGLGTLVASITPAKAKNAVNVTARAPRAALVVGAPKVSLTYAGKVSGPRPARVFAQLVDDRTGLVVGNQITPIPLTLDGKRHTITRPLEAIAQRMRKGDRLTLQLTATTVSYTLPRLGSRVTFSRVALTLPTVQG